jgi:DNA-binding transcriptional ArsR family regulator
MPLAVGDAGAHHLDIVPQTVIEVVDPPASGEAPAVAAAAASDVPAPPVPPADATTTDPPGVPPTARDLTDPRELRAMTHPVRLALLEALSLNEVLTATEAGELLGESPTTCSFHLRQLAKYGFVEEAGSAAGRRRPWKLSVREVRFSSAGGDPEMGSASAALETLLVQRWFDRFSRWQVTRSHYPAEWQEAAVTLETLVHVTPSELLEVQAQLVSVLDRFRDRATDPSLRPPDSRPIEFLSFGFPFLATQSTAQT